MVEQLYDVLSNSVPRVGIVGNKVVHRFRCWRQIDCDNLLAARVVPRKKINSISGTIILDDTAQDIDESELDTYRFFLPNEK